MPSFFDRRRVGLDLHAQHFGPLAAVDREHAMGRNPAQRFAEIEVVVKLLILLRVVLELRAERTCQFCDTACGPSGEPRGLR